MLQHRRKYHALKVMENGKVEKKQKDTTRQAGITKSTPSQRHTVLRQSGHTNNGNFRFFVLYSIEIWIEQIVIFSVRHEIFLPIVCYLIVSFVEIEFLCVHKRSHFFYPFG
jgi:hypothetical protein